MDGICLQPLFLRILYISGRILNILRFVIPIILIIMVGIDIYGRIMNPDDKDGLNKIKNRIIAAIIVFLTPTIISIVYEFIEKNIVNNNYSDMTVCREFANIEHIRSLEEDMEEIEKEKANLEKDSNLSAHQQWIEAVRIVTKKDNSNSDNNNDSNNGGTQPDTSNLSGEMKRGQYYNWNYYLYVPEGAKTSSKPLVIFLHGSGESGNDISKLNNHGFAKFINKKGKNYDAYILMPQLNSNEKWDTKANREKLMNLIKQIVNANNINNSKISISGYSLGTVVLPNLVEENPNYFSAVVFIALCSNADSSASFFRNIPTRLYYGSSDNNCKPFHSTSFEKAIKNVNGNVELIKKDANHSTIADVVLGDDEAINWMTAKKR